MDLIFATIMAAVISGVFSCIITNALLRKNYVNNIVIKNPDRFDRITVDVLQEIQRQDDKWGAERDNHPLLWAAILAEEVGEFNKEILEADCAVDQIGENYRTELIQIISVAMQAVLHYDKIIKKC